MDKKTLRIFRPGLSTPCEVPLSGGTVRAGFPSPADDFLDMPLDLNRELVPNPASTFFVRVEGDSMTGDGIGDGDLLAVCYVDGEFTVKRVKLEAAGAWLLPSNPAYPPIRVDADNEFSIWGVVRHVVKTFK